MESIFEKLSYSQIKILIDVIRTTTSGDFDFIKKKYQSQADNFEGAFNFLKYLRMIKIKEGKIVEVREFRKFLNSNTPDDKFIKSYLLDKILNSRTYFSDEVFEYLNNFKVSRGVFQYKPATNIRLRESGIRNLFIEFDLIQYDKGHLSYQISDKYFAIFADYIERVKLTPDELIYLLNRKEELGMAAELAILEYERKRLSRYPLLVKNLEHISKFNVKAGYDIKSFETDRDEGKQIPRYIEVKAVSKFNLKFNWSRNEIDKAKLYSKQYYLYLLPVISDRAFDIEGIEIIQDPYKIIFRSDIIWKNQVEQYSLWKKRID